MNLVIEHCIKNDLEELKKINHKENDSNISNESLENHAATIQHVKNKLTARERIEALVDKNIVGLSSFEEFGSLAKHRCTNFGMQDKLIPGDGVVTGVGQVSGISTYITSQDFSQYGGSLGEMHANKIKIAIERAIDQKSPIVFFTDSGGARIHEGVDSLRGYGEIFNANVRASGKILQISIIAGPCAGGAVYSAALQDIVIMVEDSSYMFLTGPDVVKSVTFEDVSRDELGGADVHAKKSGVIDIACGNDVEAALCARQLLNLIYNKSGASYVSSYSGNPSSVLPLHSDEQYDIKIIIAMLVDEGSFVELKREYAGSIITGFARIDGKTIGIVANQPLMLSGCLDINSSWKAARFVRMCDNFRIPIITLVDVPGFLPGTQQEYGGIIRHGAKLLYAYSESTTLKITIIVRKAYGGAYIVMGSKHLGAHYNYAWPTAEIAVMGAEGAASIIFRKKNAEELQSAIKQYKSEIMNPALAASRLDIDEIIDPKNTRNKIIAVMRRYTDNDSPNIHGNIPL